MIGWESRKVRRLMERYPVLELTALTLCNPKTGLSECSLKMVKMGRSAYFGRVKRPRHAVNELRTDHAVSLEVTQVVGTRCCHGCFAFTVSAALRKCHRLVCLYNAYFSHSCGDDKSTVRCQHGQSLGRASFRLVRWPPTCCILVGLEAGTQNKT